jgi:hypothetical protein
MTDFWRTVRSILSAGLLCLCLWPGPARGDDSWRAELEAVCADSGAATTLSVSELTLLIGKCDALQKAIAAQEESVRKVYLRRLQMCRNLYDYVLEVKKGEQPAK